MERRRIDSESIRSMMESWYENVIPAHLASLDLRRLTYRRYLDWQAGMTESIMRGGHGQAKALDSENTVVEVNEALVSEVMHFWREVCNIGFGLVEDVYRGLCLQFLGRLVFENLDARRALDSRSAGIIFVANHQTAVESLLFSIVFSGLSHRAVVALSKTEHQSSWVGAFLRFLSEYPDAHVPSLILYVDREDPQAVLESFRSLVRMVSRENRSGLVHAEGTRVHTAGQPVASVSSALIDMACRSDVSLVPICFAGGLPSEETESLLDYPVGFGSEDIHVGVPIDARELRRLPSVSRKDHVLDRINRLIPPNETPHAPKPLFERQVRRWQERTSITDETVPVVVALSQLTDPSDETLSLLRLLERGEPSYDDSPNARWLRRLADFLLAGDNGGAGGGMPSEDHANTN